MSVAQVSIAAAAILLATLGPLGPAAAQESSSVPLFSIYKGAPRLSGPSPITQPKEGNLGTPVRFVFDPAAIDRQLAPRLSEFCGANRFNQVRNGRYFVDANIPNKDPRRFGFANGKGLNLRDPHDLSEPTELYLFEGDGTSECRVYRYTMDDQR